jgi:hypothetical protein
MNSSILTSLNNEIRESEKQMKEAEELLETRKVEIGRLLKARDALLGESGQKRRGRPAGKRTIVVDRSGNTSPPRKRGRPRKTPEESTVS